MKNNDNIQDDENNPLQNATLTTETGQKLKDRSIANLKIVCQHCKKEFDFPGVMRFDPIKKEWISGLKCVHCEKVISKNYLENRIQLFLKQLLVMYYEG